MEGLENAPSRLTRWLRDREHIDRFGNRFNYHPRSDAHSKILAQYIWDDLYRECPQIRRDFDDQRITYGINYPHEWPGTGKTKTIDLAIVLLSADGEPIRVIFSCELKTVMTEHQKSQPRLFDELSSSYLIVQAGDQEAIAAGLTVVNISDQFVSPLRQRADTALEITHHRQPDVAAHMVQHLRGLRIRESASESGFDAYCTFVVDCDNQGRSELWLQPPSPQPRDADHYDTFIAGICRAYNERFASIVL